MPNHLSTVIVPEDGDLTRGRAWVGWMRLKARQVLPDGTSGRIDYARQCRLAAMPSALPAGPGIEEPVNDIDAARIAAHPAVQAAIARLRARREGGVA